MSSTFAPLGMTLPCSATKSMPSSPRATELRPDEQGTVFVEYVVVLALVAMAAVGAMIALGPRLLGLFHYQQALLLSPIP